MTMVILCFERSISPDHGEGVLGLLYIAYLVSSYFMTDEWSGLSLGGLGQEVPLVRDSIHTDGNKSLYYNCL